MNDAPNANWPRIIALALKADADLGKYSKPGRGTRWVYLNSYRAACAHGYHGSESDWRHFIRTRCRAHYSRKK